MWGEKNHFKGVTEVTLAHPLKGEGTPFFGKCEHGAL